MKRIVLFLALSLMSGQALAADNAVTLTAGSGVTMRTRDVGSGVQSPYNILGDVTGTAIYGTAGSSNSNVLSVQGIASGTAMPVSQSGTWNITNVSGTVSLPTGASTAANQATALTTLSTIATNTTSIATAANQTTANSSLSTIATNTTTSMSGTTPGTAPSRTNIVGLIYNSSAPTATTGQTLPLQGDVNGNLKVTAATLEPCQAVAKTSVNISQTTSTQLFAGTSSKKTYICSIMLVAADAENVSLVAGTGSVCATGTSAVIGGTSAANGPNLAANGGFALGSGLATVASGTVNADNICLLQSASGRVAGVVTYVQN